MEACSPAGDRPSLAGLLVAVLVGHAVGWLSFPWVRPVLDWWFSP